MKKIVLLILIAFAINIKFADAQAIISEGDMMINGGLGCASSAYNKHWKDKDGNFFVPTFNVAFDCGIIDDLLNRHTSLTAGIYTGWGAGSTKDEFIDTLGLVRRRDMKWNIGVRGLFHYGFAECFDAYAGFQTGFAMDKWKYKDKEKKSNTKGDEITSWNYKRFQFAPTLGAKFMITDNLGIYTELSWQRTAFFQIGGTFKFD